MQAISLGHNYSIFNFLLKSLNFGQDGEKFQKSEYFKKWKSEIKNIFYGFWGLFFCEI